MKQSLALFFALTTGALAAPAASFSATPSADAFVATGSGGDLAGNNYGGAGALAVAAPGLAKGEFQSVLRFDLSGAANSFNSAFGVDQWTVESITLQLTAAPANNAIFNPTAAGLFAISWMLNDSWMEGTGGPTAPTIDGVTFASLLGVFAGAGDENLGAYGLPGASGSGQAMTYALDFTPELAADALMSDELSLRLLAADDHVSGVFNSRNFGVAANRPLLTMVAVPEQGTKSFAALGLVLMGVLRCRGGFFPQ